MNDKLLDNLIVHRGCHNQYIPENTLPAFYKAISNNYIIELDVRLLRDGTIVVFHDSTLKRLLNINKKIEYYSYEELVNLKISGKYIIPKLQDVLNLVNSSVPVLIDVKGNLSNYALEKNLINLLRNYGGTVYIQSFNPSTLVWFKRHAKKYKCGLIIYNYVHLKLIDKFFLNFRCDFISVNLIGVKNSKLQRCRRNKILIGWTVNTREDLVKYSNYCDNFICENIL